MRIVILSIFLCNLVPVSSTQAASWTLVTGSFPPYSGADLPAGGIAGDIIDRVFENLGHSVSYDFLPWKRGFVESRQLNYLGTFPYSWNAERAEHWRYSAPLYRLQEVFFTLRDRPFEYHRPEDLTGMSICKPIGYNLFGLNELEQQSRITIERPLTLPDCFRMLKGRRVDLVLTNSETARALLADEAQTIVEVTEPYLDIAHYLIIAKDHPEVEILSDFNRELSRLKANGEIERLIQAHTR